MYSQNLISLHLLSIPHKIASFLIKQKNLNICEVMDSALE